MDDVNFFADCSLCFAIWKLKIHSCYLFSTTTGLQSLRENETFCDITVTVDEVDFHTHKVILVAISPVFCAMFTSGLSESTSDRITLQDDVDLSAEGWFYCLNCRLG